MWRNDQSAYDAFAFYNAPKPSFIETYQMPGEIENSSKNSLPP